MTPTPGPRIWFLTFPVKSHVLKSVFYVLMLKLKSQSSVSSSRLTAWNEWWNISGGRVEALPLGIRMYIFNCRHFHSNENKKPSLRDKKQSLLEEKLEQWDHNLFHQFVLIIASWHDREKKPKTKLPNPTRPNFIVFLKATSVS